MLLKATESTRDKKSFMVDSKLHSIIMRKKEEILKNHETAVLIEKININLNSYISSVS